MTGHIFRTFHSTYDSRIVIFYHFTYVSKYLQFLFFHSLVCKQLLYYMYSIPYLNEPYSIRQGSPASGSWTSTGQWHFRSQATRKVNGRWMSKASSNTYHISPLLAFPSMEKLSSAKLVPGAKKVGDHCYMEKTRPKDNGMHVQLLQSCPTLCDPMDCSPPCSSVHEILQARILEWIAISSSRGSSPPRGRVSLIIRPQYWKFD